VLSIGKVGAGQGSPNYYVEHVAQGAEDYYAGHGEARGRWHGQGATSRGLDGEVDSDDFLNLLGADPANGKTVFGYDLTFSAPKSVSLLFGLGDLQTSRLTRDAHDHAVQQALDYLERHACWTRRGRGGRTRLQGDGLTVATFRHRTSRAGDPQLHTHAVVANAPTATGSTTALDGQALYAHARTAGYLYQAALRDQLTRTVGVD
jgi:conjugative relaxase-like TrwC/TraI family protein